MTKFLILWAVFMGLIALDSGLRSYGERARQKRIEKYINRKNL